VLSGAFRWANTATLYGSGVVVKVGHDYRWNADAFEADGALKAEYVNIQDPTNEACGQCHGLVHTDLDTPLVLTGCDPQVSRTAATGQVISPQRISDSGMNLAAKDTLTRSWDIHAERGVECTDCHFALNNPVYYQAEQTLDHLTFDPRRLEINEYLQRPLHQFARGQSNLNLAGGQEQIASAMPATMRRCESCHDADAAHTWLPYRQRHMAQLACETCHIPQIAAPAYEQVDWTVIQSDATPQTVCRGVSGESGSLNALLTGYTPVLMPRGSSDGQTRLSPYNLVASWYWVYGDPPRPVRQQDLEAAFLDGEIHAPEVVSVFDQDADGMLADSELLINTSEKQTFIAERLSDLGLAAPRIVGDIQPYSLNHNVVNGDWAIRDCQACHSQESRVTQPLQVAAAIPGGVMPDFVADSQGVANGELYQLGTALYYRPVAQNSDLYVLGHNRVNWVDLVGALAFVGVMAAVGLHGGLRFFAALRQPRHTPQLKRVYMYSFYNRLWHWLQTITILLLLFTGLVIHKPDTFGLFSFTGVVLTHNVLAAILVINAALSLFYHLVSGKIQQFIPRPMGFFDDAIVQARFYLQGIFKGELHPFEKTPDKKLNPLQQVTYFGILNVLLPLQTITGVLMWGAQRWPETAARLGGVSLLAPFHSLIAWFFAAFILAHVYLTTTGHRPLSSMEAMILGWDEVEVYDPGVEPAVSPLSVSNEEVDACS